MLLAAPRIRDTDHNLIAVDKNGVSKSSERLSENYKSSLTDFVRSSEITSQLSRSSINDTLITVHSLLSWGPGWDSYDALAPNPRAVGYAKNLLVYLFQTVEQLGLFWLKPNVSASPEGEVVLEWWYRKRKLTIYVGEENLDYVEVWGPDIHSKITDGDIENIHKLRSLWVWLIS
ncbi:MAG TPA: hypothetical protein VJ761_08240 [Ktedonobacteraceae bacterium]|nr:hypothetical protein [Ktedonobacteraceae bacterium]